MLLARAPDVVSGYLPPLFLTGTLPRGLELYYGDFLPVTVNACNEIPIATTRGDFIIFKSTDPEFTLSFNDWEQRVGVGTVTLFTAAMQYVIIKYGSSKPEGVEMEGWIFVLREKDPTRKILYKMSNSLNFAIGTVGAWMHTGGTVSDRRDPDGTGVHARLTITDVPESKYLELTWKIDQLVHDGILSYKDYPFAPLPNGWMVTEMGRKYPDDPADRHVYITRLNFVAGTTKKELKDLRWA